MHPTTIAVRYPAADLRSAAFGALRCGYRGSSMFRVTHRKGRGTRVSGFPGCLVTSLLLSITLTILVNVLIRLF
jgi:hypothetical protein